jgi:pimeloyl-ACP methyl ester carboxylesterase
VTGAGPLVLTRMGVRFAGRHLPVTIGRGGVSVAADNGNLTMDGILLWNNNIGSGSGDTLASQVHSSTLTFAEGTRALAREIPGAELEVVPDATHAAYDDRPEAFAALLDRVLDQG